MTNGVHKRFIKGSKTSTNNSMILSIGIHAERCGNAGDSKYPELSVDKVWAQLSQNEQAKKYFPDYAKGQAPERHYLFGIASSHFQMH